MEAENKSTASTSLPLKASGVLIVHSISKEYRRFSFMNTAGKRKLPHKRPRNSAMQAANATHFSFVRTTPRLVYVEILLLFLLQILSAAFAGSEIETTIFHTRESTSFRWHSFDERKGLLRTNPIPEERKRETISSTRPEIQSSKVRKQSRRWGM